MITSYYLLFLLIASILFIIWLTAYKKVNAFFALSLAALAIGIFSGIPSAEIVEALKAGFGHTMEKIGLLIILGSTLGVILESTGATLSMATYILGKVKEKNAPLAIAITGFIIGLPIFCDSGFIILSGLNSSLVMKTHYRMPVMASVLGVSLYAVHCLVPPHPGITVAVAATAADMGIVMIIGIGLAIPATIIGYIWSVWKGKKVKDNNNGVAQPASISNTDLPNAGLSFLPVVLPILLIAIKSVVTLFMGKDQMTEHPLYAFISFIGDPVIALAIGIGVSFTLIRKTSKNQLSKWLADGVEKAGMILAIIAAGGMFGEMLAHTGLSKNLGNLLGNLSLGIFFPFLITSILKTAQGSTTVAIITASTLITPMMHELHLDSALRTALMVLSMGAGSMVVSHANDAYFWVISRFSNLDTSSTLKVYSVATLLMGITVQLIIWVLFMLL
jgi:GntP family gluconate:H+ symporter